MVVFIALGVLLVLLAVSLNISYLMFNWRTGLMVVLGVIVSLLIIAGITLNTIFLVREIRRNEQHDRFINAVTHELKTPIASIRLYLETLQRHPIDETRRQEFYTRMMEDNDRLLSTVQQILRAGEAGAKGVKRDARSRLPVDMRALALECLNEALRRYHLDEDAVHFEDTARGRDVIVSGDVEDLRTAIRNVLDNAVKYSGTQVDLTVELGIVDEKQALLRITDKGVGIPPALLNRVFYRFYRVNQRDTSRVKGTGLGLFIVRAIARKHGGEVSAQSRGVGRGTTITLQLPRMLESASVRAEVEHARG